MIVVRAWCRRFIKTVHFNSMVEYFKYLSFCLLAVAAVALLPACEVINPDEGIPAYIHIDTIYLKTTLLTEGSPSHKITDAWVYVDDQLIGAYELPATVPVLYSGSHKITINAGIKMNGIAATRIPYPFYAPSIVTKDLFPDSIITINPTVKYLSTTVFEWIEDFESSGFTLDTTSSSDSTIIRVNGADVFEGTYSGLFALRNPPHLLFECKTISPFHLPKSGSAVFLELNYKCNNHFAIGIFEKEGGIETQVPQTIQINPSEKWNKIYVNLTNEVSLFPNATENKIYFGVIPDPGNPLPKVYVDNIKLLH